MHVHSSMGSLLDALNTPEELVKKAKSLGQKAIAISDHGSMHGFYELYKHAKANDIKPIIGVEAYITEDIYAKKRGYDHLVLLAKNKTGLNNLFELVSRSNTEGFYYKPRIDFDMLKVYSEGLIVLSACMGGTVAKRLLEAEYDMAKAVAQRYKKHFGEDYYLEIMAINMDRQYELNEKLAWLSDQLNIELVATNDVHYLDKKDDVTQDVLITIDNGDTLNNPNRFKIDGDEDLKDEETMREYLFKDNNKYKKQINQAINNTMIIANKIEDYDIDTSLKLPVFPIPEGYTLESYLEEIAYQRLFKLALRKDIDIDEYTKRLKYELDIINMKGYAGYFLVVSDYNSWARKNNILVGPGRGCFVPDTDVLMNDGTVKTIQNVNIGDKVITHTGEEKEVYDTPKYNIKETMYEIVSSNVKKVTATNDHKFLVLQSGQCNNPTYKRSWCNNKCRQYPKNRSCDFKVKQKLKWVEAQNIKKGDYLCYPKTKAKNNHFVYDLSKIDNRLSFNEKYVWYDRKYHKDNLGNPTDKIYRYIEFDEKFAKLAGLYIGNGWNRISDKYESYDIGVAFHSDHINKIDETRHLLKDIFGLDSNLYKHNNRQATTVEVKSKTLSLFFENFFGHGAGNKKIPSELLNNTQSVLKSLIIGLLETDGCIKSKEQKVIYSTTSKNLAYQVQLLFNKLGYYAGIKKYIRKEEKWNDEYQIYISGKQLNKFKKNIMTQVVTLDQKYYRNRHLEDEMYYYFRVEKTNKISYEGKVYDLSVKDNTSYITNGITVHNSAGGSLLSYLLDIIAFDPLDYGLMFDRFLNPERESMPDIDLDYPKFEGRSRVIDYVTDKYGQDHVAQICTFGTMAAKGVIRDVGKTLGYDNDTRDKIAKTIPGTPKITIDKALEESEEFKAYQKKYPELFKYAKMAESKPKNLSKHASAVLITPDKVTKYTPLARTKNSQTGEISYVSQTEMHNSEELGLLKMDFLGLQTLDLIENTIKLIHQRKDLDKFDFIPTVQNIWEHIPLNDEDVFKKVYCKGDTNGIFQVESYLFKDIVTRMKPTRFEHIIALVALGRPGPIDAGLVDKYINRMHGREDVEYPHDDLKDVLAETYGLPIYQEQIMGMARVIAGFSLGQADILRRGMGKKKRKVIDEMKVKFIDGALKSGHSKEFAEDLFSTIEYFAGYGFNKSHKYIVA